jgi:DNA-binding LacI/PurR family transcriptional regulator
VDKKDASPRVRPAAARKAGGSERLNIADIAALANVSTSAVSYALNGREGVGDETRKRILDIAAAANWRPNSAARSLIMARSSAVGIVNQYDPDKPALSAEFTGHFLVGLQDSLRREDVLLVMHMVDDVDAACGVYQRWLGERRVDGVLMLNPLLDDPRIAELERLGLPAVVVGDARRRSTLSSVWTDDAVATGLAVDHLVGLGHRRIVRIGGDPLFLHVDIRRRAFAKAMKDHGLVHDERFSAGATTVEEVIAAVRDPERPVTALVIEDSAEAVKLVSALMEHGVRVPEDVSVIAWDDESESTLVRPPLTVLRRDIEEYGRLAARALLDAIETGTKKHVRGSHTELIVRGSTAAPAR